MNYCDSLSAKRLTACVTCVWAGVDSVWEQEKPEARKMLENAAESHTSGARFVGRILPRPSFFHGVSLSFPYILEFGEYLDIDAKTLSPFPKLSFWFVWQSLF